MTFFTVYLHRVIGTAPLTLINHGDIFHIISTNDNIIYGQQLELDSLSRGIGKKGISEVREASTRFTIHGSRFSVKLAPGSRFTMQM